MQILVLVTMFLNIVTSNLARKSANSIFKFEYMQLVVERAALYLYGVYSPRYMTSRTWFDVLHVSAINF